ncbi:ammonium transporter 2-like [Convolutriloba macropyga]|uniref:ammonium transporter 2-like n=1 Tax=Convolutriloba macropyga TaxID=536237 RepID=UPI003F51B73F
MNSTEGAIVVVEETTTVAASNPWDDATWILTSTFIVFTMQSGFGMLESGAVSRKHECNIMMKNCLDVIFGGLSYWSMGFAFSFGSSWHGLIGYSDFFTTVTEENHLGTTYAQYFYQLALCTTSTTVVSGALAERFSFGCYMIFSIFNTLIYCVPVHWLWSPQGWLNKLGAIDIGGSGVVHMVGGLTGLVGAWMVGPRTGRYDGSTSRDFERMDSPTNSLLGMFILWWGWLGFNCGSTYGVAGGKWKLASVAAVTTINASVAGGFVAFIISYIAKSGKFELHYIISGTLGGLVSITSQCAVVAPLEAFAIGLIGGALTIGCHELITRVLRVDDPVGSVSVHGVGGAWGVISFAIFAHSDFTEVGLIEEAGLINGGHISLLGKQLVYVLVVGGWTVLATYITLKPLDLLIGLRANIVVEILGADVVEHSLAGCYDHSTNLLFDELHNVVGHVNTRSSTLVKDLEMLYKKLQATNRANYILKLRRGWGETNRDSSLYASRRKYNWAGIVGNNRFFLYGATEPNQQQDVEVAQQQGDNGQETPDDMNNDSLRRRNTPNIHPDLPSENFGYLPD